MTPRLLPTLLVTLVATSALVAPATAHAGRRGHHHHGPPPGRVVVTNHSGGDVTVLLAGQAHYLPAWRTTEIVTMPGEATLRATYQQFGATHTLQSDRIVVMPDRTIAVTLAPEDTARVLVTNQSPFYATLEVDDRPNGSFKPGESRVVSIPAGRQELEMVADGRAFARTDLDLRPFAEPRWYAEAPRVGTLVVTNPHPIPVELVTDRGLVRTVPAYGQAVFGDLPAGDFHVTARRTTGEYIDREKADICPGATVAWRIDAPRTGFVSFDSDHWLGVKIDIDDRRVTEIGPNAFHQLELPVGRHEVEVKDERGRELVDIYVEVKPFDVTEVSFGTRNHERAYDGRDRDDRRSDRDRHDRDSAYAYDH